MPSYIKRLNEWVNRNVWKILMWIVSHKFIHFTYLRARVYTIFPKGPKTIRIQNTQNSLYNSYVHFRCDKMFGARPKSERKGKTRKIKLSTSKNPFYCVAFYVMTATIEPSTMSVLLIKFICALEWWMRYTLTFDIYKWNFTHTHTHNTVHHPQINWCLNVFLWVFEMFSRRAKN